LVVDPAYQRPIIGRGRHNVDRIARTFSWSCFAPVVVAPVEGGKFAIIDGQHRTTAAALVGLESVPCHVVAAAREAQAAAFKAINGVTTPISYRGTAGRQSKLPPRRCRPRRTGSARN